MKLRLAKVVACVGTLWVGGLTQAVYSEMALVADLGKVDLVSQNSQQLSPEQIQARARAITVKVKAGQSWGSGILIQRQGPVYTVITNAHVLRLGSNYTLETSDGKVYTAQVKANQLSDDDLALLEFRSEATYPVANFADASSSLRVGDETFAGGFPAQEKGFTFTSGKIFYLLPQPFIGGYQIGYSNDIFKGMSGGPVLNQQGKVIAINGKHKYPLWGNTYIFKDGSTPVEQVRREMDSFSWAIPIQTLLQQVPQLGSRASVPFEEQVPVSEITTVSPEQPEEPEIIESNQAEVNSAKEPIVSSPNCANNEVACRQPFW